MRIPKTDQHIVTRLATLHPRAHRPHDVTGLKLWYDPRTVFEGVGTLTPYARKELRRRRRANLVAKAARKRNR